MLRATDRHDLPEPSPGAESDGLLASVVISTYNRRSALRQTLEALDGQTIPPDRYEVLVVDDGSTDDTSTFLAGAAYSYALRTFRQPGNSGIGAAKNVALRHARGRYVVIMADDLIVPPEFLATHVRTLETYPGYWVVGGFQQLPSLTETPFGRYLDRLERSFEEARKRRPLAPGIWELTAPTSRNLSLRRTELERIGLYDEQFRKGCEDQDLGHRAEAAGIRFLYNAALSSLHNDQAGDLERYCRAVRNSTHDTVLFVAKYPAVHGHAPVVRVNGYCRVNDGPRLLAKKLVKRLLATAPMTTLFAQGIALAERARLPEALLDRLYHTLIALSMFRGWRDGLRTRERRAPGVDRRS